MPGDAVAVVMFLGFGALVAALSSIALLEERAKRELKENRLSFDRSTVIIDGPQQLPPDR